MSRRRISVHKEKWYEKVLVQVVSACLIAAFGFPISYYLFVKKARHEDELYGYKDGIFYAVKRMGYSIKGQSISTVIGKRYFDHWDLYKNGNPITSPAMLKRAVEETTEGIWRTPDKIRLYWLRGLALFKLKQYDLAITDFGYVYHKWPHFINAGLAMAAAYCELKIHYKARDLLEVMYKKKRQYPVTAAFFNSFGNVCCAQQMGVAAIEHYGQAIRLDPNHSLAYYNRGMAFLENAGQRSVWRPGKLPYSNHLRAIIDFVIASALKNDFGAAYHNCGLILYKLSFFKLAAEQYEMAIKCNSRSAATYNNLAVIYQHYPQPGDWIKALHQYDLAIKIDPSYPFSYWNRATAYLRIGETNIFNIYCYALAILDYEKVIELNPGFAYAYSNISHAYLQLGLYLQVIKTASCALEINPVDDIAYHNRGEAYFRSAGTMSGWMADVVYYLAILDLSNSIEISGLGETYCLRAKACRKLGIYEVAKRDKQEAENSGFPCRLESTE